MRSLQDISEFHLQFITISTYLLANSLVSARELSQSYLRVFDASFQARIVMRINILLPHHNPALPHMIDDLYNAAKWVLQGAPATIGLTTATPMYAATTPTITNESGFVKTEQLGLFLNNFKKSIVDAITVSRMRPTNSVSTPSRTAKCLFDGCESFICDCPAVEEYIQQGKCRRNHKGKVILSTGAYVPRKIPGENLRDRIDEWHRRNPGQLANGILSSNAALFGAVVNDSRTISMPHVKPETTPQYHLNAQDRIAAIECELFNLRTRHRPGFVPTIKTRSQRAAARNTTREEVAKGIREDSEVEQVRNTEAMREPTPRRSASPVDQEPLVAARNPTQANDHPFCNAKDATYAPPQLRNDGPPAKPTYPANRTNDPRYNR